MTAGVPSDHLVTGTKNVVTGSRSPCAAIRGAVEVCAPGRAVGVGKEEHEMRMPVAVGVGQVSLL
jgi:hypothetical protein